jgi:ATP-binding cassette subfamily B protein
MLSDIVALWAHLGKKRRLQLLVLSVLMIISVFTEVLSIGAVVPFLSALTNPDALMKSEWFGPVVDMLDIHSSGELLLPLTLAFVGASVVAGGLRILLLWVNTRLGATMGLQLRSEVFGVSSCCEHTVCCSRSYFGYGNCDGAP